MKQHFTPPTTGLVLEIGSGDNPHPRSDILVDRFLLDNTERGSDLIVDRPLVVADAHHLPFSRDAFAYSICSHILEHMDDPVQFAQEVERVSEAGYIGSPSEIAERLFHWSFHRWYVNIQDGMLVLHPKEPGEPFGELFDYLYAYNPIYHFFQRSMPHLFWVEYEWYGAIRLRVTDTSPLPLQDPEFLRKLVRPRYSLPRLLVMLSTALLVRIVDADTRQKLRHLIRRSYV